MRFNNKVELPHDLTIQQIELAMNDCVTVIKNYDKFAISNDLPNLVDLQTPAGFSSMISEMAIKKLTQHCSTLCQNTYHNGHPDLIPVGIYPNNSILKGTQGIEVKASKLLSGWQGHNPEDVFLLIFVYSLNPEFRFRKVLGANLLKEDWTYSGRNSESRRTITASVNKYGMKKLRTNWIYDEDAVGNY